MRTNVLLMTAIALAMLVAVAVAWGEGEARAEGTDTTSPTVTRTVPVAKTTCVDPTANASAFFSEDMKPSSINDTTVRLFRKDSATRVAASVRYGGVRDRAIVNPTDPLEGGVTYRAVVTTYVKDLAGNRLDQDSALTGLQRKSWTFTTSANSETPLECEQAQAARHDLQNAATAARACAADNFGSYGKCVTVAQLEPYGFTLTAGVEVNGMNGILYDWSAAMQHSGGGSAYTYATFGDNAGQVTPAPRGTSAPILPDRTAEYEALALHDLENAVAAADACAADNDGSYATCTIATLSASYGFESSFDVVTTVVSATSSRWVAASHHQNLPAGDYYQYDTATGEYQHFPQ
jgi:hypothetical protein